MYRRIFIIDYGTSSNQSCGTELSKPTRTVQTFLNRYQNFDAAPRLQPFVSVLLYNMYSSVPVRPQIRGPYGG